MKSRLRLADSMRPGEHQASCFGTQTDAGGREDRGYAVSGAGVRPEAFRLKHVSIGKSSLRLPAALRSGTHAEYRPQECLSQGRSATDLQLNQQL